MEQWEIFIAGAGRVFCRADETLLSALRRQGVHLSAVCGGGGRCGKCGVRVLEGDLPAAPADRAAFAPEQLAEGWRLACAARPRGSLKIALPPSEADGFQALGARAEAGAAPAGEVRVAVDLGTTTLAFALLDARGRTLAAHTALNGQRAYGADVIARIGAANAGARQALTDLIRRDLAAGVGVLLRGAGLGEERVAALAVAGNTTMLHLLLGLDCQTLGVAPFAPVELAPAPRPLRELLPGFETDAPVYPLPGISTFVGADIVSGLTHLNFDRPQGPCLLIDLGTNGEMALGDGERLLCCSTAAGPAFEGGGIRWGAGSVPGAICRVRIQGGAAAVETIGGAEPMGICGTGVVDAAAQLVAGGLADETGRLAGECFREGFPLAQTADGRTIVFTQKDMREVQLAKAAVRAGLETLLLRFGARCEDLRAVYLAGGFGHALDAQSAAQIGLIPRALLPKVRTVGNASLLGATQALTEPGARERAARIAAAAREISLSEDADFQSLYVEHMLFAEES